MLTSFEILTERFNIHPIPLFVKYQKYPLFRPKIVCKKRLRAGVPWNLCPSYVRRCRLTFTTLHEPIRRCAVHIGAYPFYKILSLRRGL